MTIKQLILGILVRSSSCDTHLFGQIAEDFSKSSDWKVEYNRIYGGYYDNGEFTPLPNLILSVKLSNYLLDAPTFTLRIQPAMDSIEEISDTKVNYSAELVSEEQHEAVGSKEITYQDILDLNIKEEILMNFRLGTQKILQKYVSSWYRKPDDVIEESVESFDANKRYEEIVNPENLTAEKIRDLEKTESNEDMEYYWYELENNIPERKRIIKEIRNGETDVSVLGETIYVEFKDKEQMHIVPSDYDISFGEWFISFQYMYNLFTKKYSTKDLIYVFGIKPEIISESLSNIKTLIRTNSRPSYIEESVEEFVSRNRPTLDNCWDFAREFIKNWDNKDVYNADKLCFKDSDSIKKFESVLLKYFPKEIIELKSKDIMERSSMSYPFNAIPLCSYLESLILLTDIRDPDEAEIIENFNDRLQPVIQLKKQTNGTCLYGEIFFGNNTDLYTDDFLPDLPKERFILNVHDNEGEIDVFGQVLDFTTLVNLFKIPEELLQKLVLLSLKSGLEKPDVIEESAKKEYKQIKKVSDNPTIQKLYKLVLNQEYGSSKKKEIENYYEPVFKDIENNNKDWKFIPITSSERTFGRQDYSILQLHFSNEFYRDNHIEIEPKYDYSEKKEKKQISDIDFRVKLGICTEGYNEYLISYKDLLQLNIPNDVLTQFLQSINKEISDTLEDFYSSEKIAYRNELHKSWNDPLEVDPNEVIEEAVSKPVVRDNEEIWEHIKNNDIFSSRTDEEFKNLQYDTIEAIRNSDDIFVGYVDYNGNPITEDNKPIFEEDIYSAIVVKIKLNNKPKKAIIEFNPVYNNFSYTIEPTGRNLGMMNINASMLEEIYNIPREFIEDCITLGYNSKRYEYYRLDKVNTDNKPIEESEELPSMEDIEKEVNSWDETKEEEALLDKVGELLPTAQYRLGKYCVPEKCKAIIEMVSHPENWKLERANSSVPYFKYIVKDIEHVEYFDLTFDRNNEDVISNVYLPYSLSLHYNPEQYFGITDVIFHSLSFSDIINLLHIPLEVARQVQEKNIEYTSQYRNYLTKSDREVIEESMNIGLDVDKIKKRLLKSLTGYSVHDEKIVEPLKNNLIDLTGEYYDTRIIDIAIRDIRKQVKNWDLNSKTLLVDEFFKELSLLISVRDTPEEEFVNDSIYLPLIDTNIVSCFTKEFPALIYNSKKVLYIDVNYEELKEVFNISQKNLELLAQAKLRKENEFSVRDNGRRNEDIIEESESLDDIEKRKQEIIDFSDEELEEDILEDDRRAREEQIYEIRNGKKEIVNKVVDSGISVEFENGNDDIGYSALISLSFNSNSFGKWEINVEDCYYGNFFDYYSTKDLVTIFGVSIDLINEYRKTVNINDKIDQSDIVWQARMNQENIIEESIEEKEYNSIYRKLLKQVSGKTSKEKIDSLISTLKEIFSDVDPKRFDVVIKDMTIYDSETKSQFIRHLIFALTEINNIKSLENVEYEPEEDRFIDDEQKIAITPSYFKIKQPVVLDCYLTGFCLHLTIADLISVFNFPREYADKLGEIAANRRANAEKEDIDWIKKPYGDVIEESVENIESRYREIVEPYDDYTNNIQAREAQIREIKIGKQTFAEDGFGNGCIHVDFINGDEVIGTGAEIKLSQDFDFFKEDEPNTWEVRVLEYEYGGFDDLYSYKDIIYIFGIKEEVLKEYWNNCQSDLDYNAKRLFAKDEVIEESVEDSDNKVIEDFINTKLSWLANEPDDHEATKENHKYLTEIINFYRKQIAEGNYKLGYFGKHWGEIISDRTDYADQRYVLVINGTAPIEDPRYEKGLIYYDYVKKQFLVSLNGYYNLDGGRNNSISAGDIHRVFGLSEDIITKLVDYNNDLSRDDRADKEYYDEKNERLGDIEE